MKKRLLIEGEVGDNIEDAIPHVIECAKNMNDIVYLLWNGATMQVTPKSRERQVMNDYNWQLHMVDLANKEKYGELISIKQLSDNIAKFIKSYLLNMEE